MKKRDSILYGILFGILMVSMFSFMIQEHFKPFKIKDLSGYYLKPDKPKFRWEWYKSGYFQKATDNYIASNYGFREPLLRLYHQYCWDFYGKEYVSYIYPGKEHWLFYGHNVRDHYGTEMYEWFPDADSARNKFEQEVRLLNKVKGVLETYGVTLMTFIAPSKDVIYPEYLPRGEYDTTSVNAREYFARRFNETGMPCFEMNDYFLRMKDTCSFYLFPPTGDHWNFSCVYATDSLIRFMEQQRGIKMPRIEYGNEYLSTCRIGDDQNRDLEGELNLLRPIKYNKKFNYKERDYWMISDSTTVKPTVLFIGNSFLQRTIEYVYPQEVFSDFNFWYYNKVAYQGLSQLIDSVSHLNRLDYLLDPDYILWFSSASQMYRATEGFAEDAIIQLCIGEERFQQRKEQLIDSLFHDQAAHNRIAWAYPDSLYLIKLVGYTDNLLRQNPEAYFPEIAGEGIPTARNPLLLSEDYWKKRDIRKEIKSSRQWLMAVTNQMVTENISMQQAIDNEVERYLQGLPTLGDKDISADEYREILVKQMEQKIRYNKDWFEMVEKQAAEKGITVEENLYINAVYVVDQQIHEGNLILPQSEEINTANP
ncbi:MAG: hypothetical protein J6P73_04055 [Bacteroidales bacterium]|nr:hypothetical protein [Bacteroidales bacterium]